MRTRSLPTRGDSPPAATASGDQERFAFLDTLGVGAAPASTASAGGAGARPGPGLKRFVAAGAMLAASLAPALLAPGAAQAATTGQATVRAASPAADGCGVVQPRPESQTYYCGGYGQWVYTYLREYGTDTGAVCYVFDLTTYGVGCSIEVHQGERTACTVG